MEKVLDTLPHDFAKALEEGNIGVMVEEAPSAEDLNTLGISARGMTLLGLYHGVPPTRRGLGYSLVLPDNITIYRQPVEMYARQTGREVDDVVREVVLHEIAHHFGLPDKRLRELGY
ncbi:MAG TPA: metallopeptidase family protein [Candidatus Anoxymicrobiaceae bacterium]